MTITISLKCIPVVGSTSLFLSQNTNHDNYSRSVFRDARLGAIYIHVNNSNVIYI